MTTDFRALCAELVAWADNASARYYSPPEALIRARAALATDEPAVPEGREPASVAGEPSDEELAQAAKAAIHDYKYPTELVYFLDYDSFEYEPFLLALRAAIAADRARWGHQPAQPAEGEQRHPEPVPVSERLPGAEDCDAEGRCWAWDWLAEKWCLCDRTSACHGFDHWLPAHALPLPAGEVEPNAE